MTGPSNVGQGTLEGFDSQQRPEVFLPHAAERRERIDDVRGVHGRRSHPRMSRRWPASPCCFCSWVRRRRGFRLDALPVWIRLSRSGRSDGIDKKPMRSREEPGRAGPS